MKRLLVNDSLAPDAMARLKNTEGIEVDDRKRMQEQLVKDIKQFDAIIVRSATKVTKEVIEAGDRLSLIVRAGTGLDNVEVDAAKRKGIKVINTPAANSLSVAELTIGFMISMARFIPQGTMSLKEGKWLKKEFKGIELHDSTLGIIGIGRIGQLVAERALAFGMKVMAYDKYPNVKEELKEKIELLSLDELLPKSDFITVHVPLMKETHNLIGEREFEKMKDGVYFVHCARGGIVDEQALYNALVSGKVKAAALDVFEVEPPVDDLRKRLLSLNNVICTPHIGASTIQAQKRVGEEVVEKVIAELTGGEN